MAVKLSHPYRRLCATALIGISSGLMAVGFHFAMNTLFHWLVEVPAQLGFWMFAGFVLLSLAICGWLSGWLMMRFAPDAPGSGIPQVKIAYHLGRLDFSWKLIFVKFFGGVLAIGSGSSLGREGPTIHLGAAIASKIANWFGEDQETKANSICAGSAAGLAAAFSTPLAGVTLVLEEIAGGRNESKFAGRALLAAALAGCIVAAMTAGRAALPVASVSYTTMSLWVSPIVALASGGAGLLFQWFTLELRKRAKASRFRLAERVMLGAVASGVLGLAAFGLTGRLGVFGLGEADLISALTNQIFWVPAVVLLVGKLFATGVSYGSGGCGGIFAPLLFLGAMTGVAVHGVSANLVPLTNADQTVLAMVGMTACLSAVVRSPITSILIVMEMTWQIHVLPVLMIGAVVAVYLSKLSFAGNFYDEALRQDGVVIEE